MGAGRDIRMMDTLLSISAIRREKKEGLTIINPILSSRLTTSPNHLLAAEVMVILISLRTSTALVSPGSIT
jgi:hypothetical protein